MSILERAQEIKQKIKSEAVHLPSDLLIVAIVVLVGFAGFGLGRLSRIDEVKTPVKITYPESQTASVVKSLDTFSDSASSNKSGNVVASKNGTKYHLPWCGGAQRIAKKNLISFDSIEEAQKAGYTPAANCKGLK